MRREEVMANLLGFYQSVIENMVEGCAYFQIILDKSNNPIDYMFIVINNAFEKYTGLTKEHVIGKKLTEIIPDNETQFFDWVKILGKVALQGHEEVCDFYSVLLKKWYSLKIFYQENGYLVVLLNQGKEELYETKKQLKNALAWKNAVSEASTVGVLAVTGHSIITEVNPRMEELFGYTKEEMIGQSVDMVHVSQSAYDNFGEVAYFQTAYQKMVKIEYEFRRKDGTLFWAEITGSAIDPEDLTKGVIWVFVDITKRKEKEQEVEETKVLLEAAFEQNPTPMILASYPENEIQTINSACINFLEIRDIMGQFKNKSLDVILSQNTRKYSIGLPLGIDNIPLIPALKGISTKGQEFIIITKDKKEKWGLASGGPIYNKEGEQIAAMVAFSDITALKQIEEELENKNSLLKETNKILQEKAITDGLTNIYNHQHIVNTLKKISEQAKSSNENLSIIMLDIDHFKRVNDGYGHQIGDQVIINVAETIKQNIREADLVGRYGGEEYLVVLPETNLQEAVKIAENIRQKIEQKEFIDRKLKITVSQGIAEYNGAEIIDLIQIADQCLYKAKRKGRNRINF